MGLSLCNNSQSTFDSESQKLFQINTESNNKLENVNNNNSNNDTGVNANQPEDSQQHNQDKKKSLFLSILDINNEKYYTSDINLRILSTLKGISQLNVNNSLYLCGTNDITSTCGSYLLNIELHKKNEPLVKFLVSSNYVHIHPSLFFSKHINSLFAIGGKDQIKCELFDIENNKWKSLPDLPEERYLCTLMSNGKGQHMYLFGGFCKSNNTKCSSLLRLNLLKRKYWEELHLDHNSELIQKTSSAAFSLYDKDTDRDCIYILGGKNANKEYSDDIVEYNVNKTTINLIDKLNEKTTFLNQSGVNISSRSFLFYDKKAKVINVDVCEYSIKCSTYGDCDYVIQSKRKQD
jgi:hypothetical protein